MKGWEALPELIRRSGNEVVFGMLGATNAAFVAKGVDAGAFRFVKTRHEETATNAAAAYSRSTDRIGICTVTRGPGFANTVNALICATDSHIPLLLIVAESPATNSKTEQNIDQRGFTAAIGCGFHHIEDVAHLERGFWTALREAKWNGHPQVLSIGDAVEDADVQLADDLPVQMRPRREPADHDAIMAAVETLQHATSPLILAGQGAAVSGCKEELVELARLTGARVGSSLRANAFFSGHPNDLGLCGSWSPPAIAPILTESDVVIAFGASLNHRTTADGQAFAGATLVHCEIDSDRPCRATSPDLALLGDAGATAAAMIDEWNARRLGARDRRYEIPDWSAVKRSILEVDLGHDEARGLDPRAVVSFLDDRLPPDRVVTTDLGRYTALLPSLIRAQEHTSWLLGRGNGSIGLGLGTAIGACVAHPNRPVVLITGDGGFMMSSHDLDAIDLNGLDLTVLILNDEQLGQDISHVVRHGLPADVLRQPMPDIPLLASAVRGRGTVVRTEADLACLDLSRRGLHLIDARIDPQVDSRAVF